MKPSRVNQARVPSWSTMVVPGTLQIDRIWSINFFIVVARLITIPDPDNALTVGKLCVEDAPDVLSGDLCALFDIPPEDTPDLRHSHDSSASAFWGERAAYNTLRFGADVQQAVVRAFVLVDAVFVNLPQPALNADFAHEVTAAESGWHFLAAELVEADTAGSLAVRDEIDRAWL